MGEIVDYQVCINWSQSRVKKISFLSNSFPLMWTCFDTRNFKRPTNWFIFGIVTAFCKLLPKTNCHIQSDIQVPAENQYKVGSYWYISITFWIWNLDYVWYKVFAISVDWEYCFYLLRVCFRTILFYFFVLFPVKITPSPSSYMYAYNNSSINLCIYLSMYSVIFSFNVMNIKTQFVFNCLL